MDLHFLHEFVQAFDSQAAQATSEQSGLIPWLASLLGLPSAWPEAITKMIDPNHPLFFGQSSSGGGGGSRGSSSNPDYSDSRLSDLLSEQGSGQGSESISLADVVGDTGTGSETITLSDVVGK